MRTIFVVAFAAIVISGVPAAGQDNPLLGSWTPEADDDRP